MGSTERGPGSQSIGGFAHRRESWSRPTVGHATHGPKFRNVA